jgi:hypothetical protein
MLALALSAAFVQSTLLSTCTVAAGLEAAVPRCCGENPDANLRADDQFQLRRIDSARLLTERAQKLEEITKALERWIIAESKVPLVIEKPKLDSEKGSVHETETVKKKESPEDFQELFQAYQTARRQYLEHKLLYDEHVALFHRQATQSQAQYQVQPIQTEGASTDMMQVPTTFNKIRLSAQDACNALQQAEFSLFTSEQRLALAINYAAKIRGKANVQVYFDAWNTAQGLSGTLQRQVVDFGHDVLNKEQTSSEQLHQATQMAVRDGDFVQSKQTYMEVQRSSALNQEETKRAHQHSMFLTQALSAVRMLNPLTNPSANVAGEAISSQQTSSPTITNDEIQSEANALEAEYDKLQAQYAAMEKANPANQK